QLRAGPAAQLRAGPTARLRAGPAAQPRVALVAPLRVSTFLSGTGPLAGLASFSPIASYLGTTVYRVTFRDGGTAYGEIVAGAVVAAPDGLSIVSSVQHVSPGLLHLSPNAGASVVGSNALLYASVDDLAAMLASPGVLPANALTRLQVQSGIAVQRDILPLI